MSVSGNAKELRKAADDLDVLMESNRKIFLERSSLGEQQLSEMMEEETFLTPEQCLEYGFIDKVDSYQADEKEIQERLKEQVLQLYSVIGQRKTFSEQMESLQQQAGMYSAPPKEKKLTDKLATFIKNM